EFHPGVREELQRGLNRAEALDTIFRVGAFLTRIEASRFSLGRLLRAAHAESDDIELNPLAMVATGVLRTMGGPAADFARSIMEPLPPANGRDDGRPDGPLCQDLVRQDLS